MTPLQIPSIGNVAAPREFARLVEGAGEVVVRDASESPGETFKLMRAGRIVVLTGEWRYIDGVMRYAQRRRSELADRSTVARLENRYQRAQAHAAALRDAFARAMVVVEGDRLWRVSDHPDLAGILEWLDPANADLRGKPFLLPVRRLQRILTDMRRAEEGMSIQALGERVTIRPHVFVPQDENVMNLLAERLELCAGATVLDLGTGTGVLALMAAKAGAAKVIATDNIPQAVENARANVESLGLADRVEVRGPADLFESVQGEQFDVIIFNAPWVAGAPSTLYEAAIYDEDFRALRGFMEQAGERLREGGRILLIYGDISQLTGQGSLTLLRELAERNGLQIVADRWVTRRARLLGARERVHLFELARSRGAECQ